jgi:hypothetical protein
MSLKVINTNCGSRSGLCQEKSSKTTYHCQGENVFTHVSLWGMALVADKIVKVSKPSFSRYMPFY